MRRWKFLFVDDDNDALNEHIISYENSMIVPQCRHIEPIYEAIQGHPPALTIYKAWQYINKTEPGMLPDIAVLDLRLDGNSDVRQDARHYEISDFSDNERQLLQCVIQEMLAKLEEKHNAYVDIFRLADDEWAEQAVNLGLENPRAENVKNKCREFLAEVREQLVCSGTEIGRGGGQAKIGFLTRGGMFLGEMLKRKAHQYNVPAPIVIYFSGSHFARMTMLPTILAGDEDLLSKDWEAGIAPILIAKLNTQAKRICKSQLEKSGDIETFKKTISLLRMDNPGEHGHQLRKCLTIKKVLDDWTIGSLFPWRMRTILQHPCECIKARKKFADELQNLLPSLPKRIVQVFTNYPLAFLLHPGSKLLDKKAQNAWGWRPPRNIGNVRPGNDNSMLYDAWAEEKSKECGKAIHELSTMRNWDEKSSRIDEQEYRWAIKNRMKQYFLDGCKENTWPFESTLVRADILEVLENVLNQCRELVLASGCEGFVKVDEESGMRYKRKDELAPLNWYCLTPLVMEYFRLDNARWPDSADLPAGVLCNAVKQFIELGVGQAALNWQSEQEPGADRYHQNTTIDVFITGDNIRPADINSANGIGGFQSLIWDPLRKARGFFYLDLFKGDKRYCASRNGTFLSYNGCDEEQKVHYPPNTNICIRLRINTYKKG